MKINKKGDKIMKSAAVFSVLFIVLMIIPLISAGVGIKWNRESLILNEGEKACMTYYAYNPWPEETYVTIELSDDLREILTMQDSEIKFIPANTPSSEAIPMEFCFKIPIVYERDCLIWNLMCKQDCNEEQKVYAGEVIVKSVPPPIGAGGAGGSATAMAVSAPLNLKVKCNAHARDFSIVYALLALICLIMIVKLLHRKYSRPKIIRDRERLRRLQEQISKEEQDERSFS